MKERMLLNVDDHVEVAGRAAGGAVLAFAVEPHSLTGRDARRDLDRQLTLATDAAGATAGVARLRDGLASPSTVSARPGDGEEPVLVAKLPCPAALTARFRRRALGGARSLAGLACFFAWNLNCGLGTRR